VPTRHAVRLAPESRLAAVLGEPDVEVCSWHHQSIDRVGAELTTVAWAADSVIEAVEHQRHPWCFGLQWHPELQPGEEPQERLFDTFIGVAAENRNSKH